MQLQLADSPAFVGADGSGVVLSARDAALLAWLALEGPTSRARLASLLWPDKDADAARNDLRQRLFRLRKVLGVDLVQGNATLGLVEGVGHDLEEADTVLGQTSGEEIAPGEFAHWLEQQRARRRDRVRRSLVELCRMAEGAKDWDDALSHARELLALEPLSEAAHLRVIRLHYLAGERVAALLAFDGCERMLKDEVGATPSAEALALLATISAAQSSTLPALAQTVPASVLLPPRLIGRDDELAALHRGWQLGQVVALIGEAGLGKTRLLHAFVEARSGVVRAAGRLGDAGVPFATLARLLRAVMARAGTTWSLDEQLPAGARTEIARVLPEFDGPATRHGGEGQRLVMRGAVRGLLTAQVDLIGLVVDDLHFADEASLEMLRALIDEDSDPDNAAARPLRWALACRPSEAGSPVRALHDALVEQARLTPIALAPLDAAALAALVDSLGLPGVEGRVLAPGLLRRTGGNPLFVLETLKQAWVERTLDRLADAALLPRPESVGRLIERRITQLSPGALALARVASIAGADFGIGMAEQVLQASAMQFADALNELEAAQVMRGNAFAHDLVHDAVRASVPATIAAHTHAKVAEWLEQRQGEPARIAAHWIAAQQAARALPWLQRAADAARRALRAKEYVAFLERKSEIEEATGQPQAAFASLILAAEEFVNVDLDSLVALAHCDRLDRLARTPQQRLEARLHRAHMHQQRGEPRLALPIEQAALRDAVRLDDARLLATCHQMLGVACSTTNQAAQALHHLQACTPWVSANGSDEQRSELHGNLAVLHDNLGQLDDALPHHELAFDLSHRSGNLSNASVACGNLACNRIDAGDLHAAERSLLQGQQIIAMYDGFGAHMGFLQVLRALSLCHLGRYGDALAQAEQAVQSMRQYQPGHVDHALLRLGACWWHLGQWSRLSQLLAAVTLDERSSVSVRVQHARLSDVVASAGMSGSTAGAVARHAMHAELAAIGAADRPDLRLPLQIDLAAHAGPEAALGRLDTLRAEGERIGHLGTVLAARIRAAGMASAIDPARARREALAALELANERQTTVLLPAELWLQCGRALVAAGDTAHAAEVLSRGRAWLRATAAEQVPEPFRDSFLQRNPVNRELLALASRWAV
jgi:DNA-binding SARP family transcriptional activator/tetratricopeptide (TPR) repeat protein